MHIKRAYIQGLHVFMVQCTWLPPIHGATIPPSRNHTTVAPSNYFTSPLATPSHRATFHEHAATVSLWHLVRHRDTTMLTCHQVCYRDTTVPLCQQVRHHYTAVPPCRRAVAVPTTHIGIPSYVHSYCILHHPPDSG